MSTSTVALTIEMPSLDASLSWNALESLVVGMSHEVPARALALALDDAQERLLQEACGPAPRATCPPPATPTRSTTRTHQARASRSSGRQYWWTSAATPRSRRRFACSPTRSRAKFNGATRYRNFAATTGRATETDAFRVALGSVLRTVYKPGWGRAEQTVGGYAATASPAGEPSMVWVKPGCQRAAELVGEVVVEHTGADLKE